MKAVVAAYRPNGSMLAQVVEHAPGRPSWWRAVGRLATLVPHDAEWRFYPFRRGYDERRMIFSIPRTLDKEK